MICPVCNTENRNSAKYCDFCGSELPTVAPDAREMFDDDPNDTARLGEEKTIDFQGFDQMNDSSYSPYDDPAQDADDARTNDLGDAEYADVTQAFMVAGQAEGERRTYIGADANAGPFPKAGAKGNPLMGKKGTPSGIGSKESPYAGAPSPSRRKRTIAIALIALLCTAIAVAAVLGITYSLQLWGGRVLPDVVGTGAQEAKAALERDGFAVSVEQVKSDEVEDVVVEMQPKAGSRLAEGSTVTLMVSVARVIPNLVGEGLDQALSLLDAEGFTNIETQEAKSNEAADSVISVNPVPGTRAKSGSKITLEVAIPYRVPNVYGMTQEEATSALEAEGYNVSVDYIYAEDLDEGLAAGTSPEAESALATGSNVVLNLAKHRSTEVVSLTRAWLNDSKQVKINGRSYEISEVADVNYTGDGTCSYSMVARQFETHSWFGIAPETRYGNYETIKGTVTWNDDNEISSMNPSIERL